MGAKNYGAKNVTSYPDLSTGLSTGYAQRYQVVVGLTAAIWAAGLSGLMPSPLRLLQDL